MMKRLSDHRSDCLRLRSIDREDARDPDEVESIVDFDGEWAESKFPADFFCPLGDIGDIADGFTIEILETREVKESPRILESSDIWDDSRKGAIDICLVELSDEGEDFDSFGSDMFLDFELSDHSEGVRYEPL